MVSNLRALDGGEAGDLSDGELRYLLSRSQPISGSGLSQGVFDQLRPRGGKVREEDGFGIRDSFTRGGSDFEVEGEFGLKSSFKGVLGSSKGGLFLIIDRGGGDGR